MSVKKETKEVTKKQKTKTRQTIAEKIDMALSEYKNELDKRKYERRLKKASKLLSEIVLTPAPKKINEKKSVAKQSRRLNNSH
jgi:hypothetical protein